MKLILWDKTVFEIECDDLIAWWNRRRKLKEIERCRHRWTVYVSVARCAFCQAFTDTNLVSAAKREGEEVDILADYSSPLRPRDLYSPGGMHAGYYTDRVTKRSVKW